MFDFEKLDVYELVNEINIQVIELFSSSELSSTEPGQILKDSTLLMLINLAQATGRISKDEKIEFITESRGCIFEAVAMLNLLKKTGMITEQQHSNLYEQFERASKMLLGMYKSYKNKVDKPNDDVL